MSLGKSPTLVPTVSEAKVTTGYSSLFVETITTGMTTATQLTQKLNANAAILELTGSYGVGNGVVNGLTIESNGEVTSGCAFIGGYVELNEAPLIDEASYEKLLYVWLTTSGDVATTTVNTAPDNSIKLGKVYKLGTFYHVSYEERPIVINGSTYAIVPDLNSDWDANIIQTPGGVYQRLPLGGWTLISMVGWFSTISNVFIPDNTELSFTGDWASEGDFSLEGNITWLD